MHMVNHTAEAFAFLKMVASILATLCGVISALATTSAYSVMVSSKWGKYSGKKIGGTQTQRKGKEAHFTTQMATQ